jgi:KDO2-lipid IV(A) lauroyltransferase
MEWAARPAKRRRLAANLAHAVGHPPEHPEVRALVRAELVNEARRSADLLWALGRPDEVRRTTEIVGIEHVREAAAAGRGVLLASIHLGGWEVATAIPKVVVPVPTTAVVADDWLAWAIAHTRFAVGLGLMYRTEPTLRALRLLQRGEALLVLGDDSWGVEPRSYPVRFLDGMARMPAGVTALSRLAGSPVVCFYVLPRGPRRWQVTIDPPLTPPERHEREEGEQRMLQRLADRWSEMIRAHPEHWAAAYRVHWLEREVG